MSDDLAQIRLCLIGYGAQGRAEALNLRRSKVSFSLGLREQGGSWQRAVDDGFCPQSIDAAIHTATHIALNIPDQDQAVFYDRTLKNKEIQALIFAHGFSSHFGLIPRVLGGPAHILVAPKGAASGLIEFYNTATALPAILAVENSGDPTRDLAFARRYALAVGCHPRGIIEAHFKDETVCDLFSEQVLLCGGVTSLVKRAYEVLVEAGYNSEAAYYETLYELKLIVDLLWRSGVTGMRTRISPTARYGDITRGDRVIGDAAKSEMKQILNEIETGDFAKEFLAKINSKEFLDKQRAQESHPLETVGHALRQKLFTESSSS